ncbi:MAG TPA: CocE/NonD family hydrolase [Pyrinomonadaceae bacterium]
MKPNRFFKLSIAILVLLFSAAASSAQPAQLTPQQRELADYIKSHYTKSEVMIPMRDGVKLFVCIYEPKDKKQKYPIMFDRTPYSVGPYGPDNYKSSLGPDELFARAGYIFVYGDVRGRYLSEGVYEDVRPYIPNKKGNQIDETTDTYDTVDWLIKNVPNNNGRVGVYGISYPGFYTSMAGIDGHPAIKAISPQAPVSDWFHGDDNHHNGALFLAQNFSFFTGFGQPRPVPTSNNDYVKPFNYGTQDGYKFYFDMGGMKNSGDAFEKQFGFRLKFWDQMMAHPNYDQFWKERNIFPNLRNIHAAVMTVGGWYDDEDLFGALGTYQSIEKQNPGIFNVLVMGPWCHGCWARTDGDWLGTAYFGMKTGVYYREHFELPFFNHFLKDLGDISQIKEVNVFDTGANQWGDLPNWSPTVSRDTPVYLMSDGKLAFGNGANEQRAFTSKLPPAGAGPRQPWYDEYVSDPWNPVPFTEKRNSDTIRYPRDFMTEDQRFAATRPDVLVYQTDPLTEDITVAGSIKPELFVSSSGTDSDFIVKLIDVFPDDYQYPETGNKLPNGQPERMRPPQDSTGSILTPNGYEMLLRGEPMPARFRNSFERPEPLRPNVPAKISYVMPGIVHTFKKGHRIMVQVQSTWFPLVARNPQKFMANYKLGSDADFQKATERVYHSPQYPSRIVLPVWKR